jgi:hypothetical protein
MFFKQCKLKLFYSAIVLLFHETTPVLICCSYYSELIFIKLSWLAAHSHSKSAYTDTLLTLFLVASFPSIICKLILTDIPVYLYIVQDVDILHAVVTNISREDREAEKFCSGDGEWWVHPTTNRSDKDDIVTHLTIGQFFWRTMHSFCNFWDCSPCMLHMEKLIFKLNCACFLKDWRPCMTRWHMTCFEVVWSFS